MSDDSFDYEDEISLENSEVSLDEISESDFSDSDSAAPATAFQALTMGDKRWMATPNQLGSTTFRPLSVRWYISEHFLEPARSLRSKILPHLALEEILMILHYKKWSVDEATSEYFENWPRLREAVGISSVSGKSADSNGSGKSADSSGSGKSGDSSGSGKSGDSNGSGQSDRFRKSPFFCSICCEAGDMLVFSLPCGHDFCASCYRLYMESCLPRGQLVRCMDPQCKLSLSYSDVEALLGVEIRKSEKVARSVSKSKSSHRKPDLSKPKKPVPEPKTHKPQPKRESTKKSAPAQSEPVEEESDSDSEWLDGLDLSGAFPECTDPLSKNPLLVAAAKVAIDTSHSRYRWCPAVDCQNLVEIEKKENEEQFFRRHSGEKSPNEIVSVDSNLATVPVVTCPASHEFCFRCQYENHLPCPCWLAANWIKRCEDDSETVNWIEANTQTCPKCEAVIEKNGGCNHMVCGKCLSEFCWICLGDWAMHKSSYWQCNRYDPKEVEELKKKQATKANSLNRYLHFYKRFSIHQVSMDGDKHTLQRVHRCMLQYMRAQSLTDEKSGSWNDIQYLADAIRSLSSGRKTLMWTYAFAFHLRKTNFSEIFEGMQDYLTKTVEDLSMLFEEITSKDSAAITDKINLRKAEIVRLAASVTRRRELLINCAHSGIEQGTLQFFTP